MPTFTKIITLHKTKYRMEVVVKLSTTNHTYFSITYTQYKEHGSKMLAGGASSETISKYFPELNDVLAMHLSDDKGIPMYALENGYFFCKELKENNEMGYDDSTIAEHFRIALVDVPTIRAMSKETLGEWVESQKPRWKVEADAMIAKYGLRQFSPSGKRNTLEIGCSFLAYTLVLRQICNVVKGFS